MLRKLQIFCTTVSALVITFSSVAQAGKSNLRAILPQITKIKDQKGRNTCTIMTTIAMLESYHYKKTGEELDLSEEWLQYLASIANGSGGAKGSMVITDFTNAQKWGLPSEKTLSYSSGEWRGSEVEAVKVCGHLSQQGGINYTRCLYGKFPISYLYASDQTLTELPKGLLFSKARSEANEARNLFTSARARSVSGNGIKDTLMANNTVALEINIYHGAWNTKTATKHGINRSDALYAQGVVTYPERGSLDRKLSPAIGSRHAVQIVGYDDDIEIKYKVKMESGEIKEFTRKGVYIFKNSWGTSGFGKKFQYDKMRIPGFGMISQDYVHKLGKATVFE